jgi:uncharacterized protein YbbC (DUF1343 family)
MFNTFKKSIPFLGVLFLMTSCSINKTNPSKNSYQKSTLSENQNSIRPNQSINFKTGADNSENYLPLLKDKKVGVVSNQTGILSNKIHLVDFLVSNAIQVQKIFAPEHGFRGTADAGELIIDGKDTKTGLPIISLYGANKKPTPEQLEGIDILIFDIQDVGARFYTYISSLHYIMEACAENNIPLLVLDRPNPNGFIIDGPILEKEFSSFVGMHPVPVLYGMTIGEYAQMINGEKWLKEEVQCNLQVIPCVDYDRNASYHITERPSPNLPNDQAINLYASLCFFEGTNVSVGRGTDKQFQIYGSPYLPQSGFSFIPEPNFGAKEPIYKGVSCFGEDLTTIEPVSQIELKWLIRAFNTTEDKTAFFNPFFTKLAGTQTLRLQIEEGISERKIKKSWKPGLDQFKEIRKKYLLY